MLVLEILAQLFARPMETNGEDVIILAIVDSKGIHTFEEIK